MRIAAGRLGGRRIPVPAAIRPSEGQVREALLSIWAERVPESRFLDLFAGSGAVGLEAWSRGAADLVLVDAAGPVVRQLRATLSALGVREAEIVRLELPDELERLTSRAGRGFDLIFADPPYAFRDHEALLAGVVPLLAPAGTVAVEHEAQCALPDAVAGLARTDSRRYGASCLSFFAAPVPREAEGAR